jgi:hypothetical protein
MSTNLLKRLYSPLISSEEVFAFDQDFERQTLEELLSKESKIVVLGEPGVGKTFELMGLFDSLWENKESKDSVPFFISLKKYHVSFNFEDLIPYQNWKELSSVTFILDGLDETAYPHDFISVLDVFINKYRNKNLKFIISSRTNIYLNNQLNLDSFKPYKLEALDLDEINRIIANEGIVDVEINQAFIDRHPFYTNPFFLIALIKYYKEKGMWLDTENEIWEYYVEFELNQYRTKQIKKRNVVIPQEKKNLKKVSLINELQGSNQIDEDTLFKVLDENYLSFIDNPFIQKQFEQDKTYTFIHRQYQEYFAALVLNELSFEELKSVILIENLNKVRLGLNNIISIILSLAGSDLFDMLSQFLIENNIEIILKSDSLRIPRATKHSIFNNYFTKQCIEKTLWIGTNSTISNVDLAQFGDSIESFDFLIDIINNKELNHRTRISAMNLIEEFKSINEGNLTETIECILESDESISFKSTAIRLLKSLSLPKRVQMFDKIVNQYADESSKQWNRSLLEVLNTIPDIDQFLNYLKNEFNWANKIIKRSDNDNVHRGNSWIVPILVLRLKSPDNFLELIPFYFNDYNLRSRESLREDIIKKCLEFENQINGFVLQLVTKLKDVGNLRTHFGEDSLFELITKTHQEFEVFKILFNPDKFEVTDQFILAKISNEETIDFLINSIKKTAINIEELKTFRNILANSGKRELARLFENQLLQFGQDIGKTPTDDDLYQNNNKIKKEVQENADLLFNNKELFEKIFALLSENEIVTINAQNIRKIERSFYEIKNNWFRGLSCEFDILFASTYMFTSLTIEQLEKELQKSKRIHLIALKGMLESNKNAQFNFEISAENLKTVKQWITTEANNFDFENLVQFESFKSFTINRCSDYQFLKTIYYYLDIDEYSNCFNDSFLLNSIVFYRMEEFKPFSEGFDKLIAKITDKGLIKSKVKEAFNTQVISSSMERIIVWALINNFDDVYNRIGEYLEFSSHSPGDELFDLYAEKNNEKALELIKKIAIDTSVYNGWSALKKLSDIKSMHEYCINRCLDYLGSGQPEFYNKALGILLKMNHPSALTYFIEGIGKNPLSNIAHNLRADYFVDLELFMDNFEKLFIPIYQTKEVKDDFDRDWEFTENNTFFTQLMNNVLKHASNTVEAYERIRTKLDEVRKESNDDRIIFFSNSISELLTNNYINLMSKPLSFEDALELTNRIIKS